MDTNTSNGPDFGNLAPYQKRKFVPDRIDLYNVDNVVSLYQKLCDRDIDSADDLKAFLADRSELDAALGQYESILYIRMTCQTDDQDRAEAYKKFVETVIPAVKPLADKLDRKYVDAAKSFGLDKKRYEVYDRNVRADVELFRKENVELQTQEELLSQEYQTLCGAMTVKFQGQECTMPQMRKFLELPDQSVRESAWRAAAERRLQDAERIDEIFDEMLSLRRQIASNAGLDNYRDYKFRQYHRFDYTPQDCKNFHKAVRKTVVPVIKLIRERRARQMHLSSLRPWDLKVDPKGCEPLRLFETIEEYKNGFSKIFGNIDADFKAQFDEMNELGLLDLGSRKGKAPGGYQTTLDEARKPFIFGNAVGIDQDITILAHEGGHAFHMLACADEPLLAYVQAPVEFCEVASMSMELFALPYLNVFYNDEEIERSKFNLLERTVYVLALIALFDSFQHWIYENPGHDSLARGEQWIKLHQLYGGQFEDWSKLDTERQCHWHAMIHLFQCPFYMIEYGIAQLGALGLWIQFKNDRSSTMSNYRKALSLGGSRPLPELFEAAGLKFDFSEETISALMEVVVKELGL